jgi:hypothetical protein
MKGSEAFKITIEEHLKAMAKRSLLFMQKFRDPNKNIDDCITYILNTVQKSGSNGFEDDEIFNMAIHYYDEDNLEVGKSNSMNVVVNHQVKLTEEEKEELRKQARQDVINEEKNRMRKKPSKTTAPQPNAGDSALGTLF